MHALPAQASPRSVAMPECAHLGPLLAAVQSQRAPAQPVQLELGPAMRINWKPPALLRAYPLATRLQQLGCCSSCVKMRPLSCVTSQDLPALHAASPLVSGLQLPAFLQMPLARRSRPGVSGKLA